MVPSPGLKINSRRLAPRPFIAGEFGCGENRARKNAVDDDGAVKSGGCNRPPMKEEAQARGRRRLDGQRVVKAADRRKTTRKKTFAIRGAAFKLSALAAFGPSFSGHPYQLIPD